MNFILLSIFLCISPSLSEVGEKLLPFPKLHNIFSKLKKRQTDGEYLEQCAIVDFPESTNLGKVNVLAFLDASWEYSHRQAVMLKDLKGRFERFGIMDIKFFVVNTMPSTITEQTEIEVEEKTWMTINSSEMEDFPSVEISLESLKETLGSEIYFIQDIPELEIWKKLHVSRDQILVVDGCGKLTYQVIVPWSILHFPYVKAAILSTFNDEPCGSCGELNFEENPVNEPINDEGIISTIRYGSTFPEDEVTTEEIDRKEIVTETGLKFMTNVEITTNPMIINDTTTILSVETRIGEEEKNTEEEVKKIEEQIKNAKEEMKIIEGQVKTIEEKNEATEENIMAKEEIKKTEEELKTQEEEMKRLEEQMKLLEEQMKVIEGQIISEEETKIEKENNTLEAKKVIEQQMKITEEQVKIIEKKIKIIEEEMKVIEEQMKVIEETTITEEIKTTEVITEGTTIVDFKTTEPTKNQIKIKEATLRPLEVTTEDTEATKTTEEIERMKTTIKDIEATEEKKTTTEEIEASEEMKTTEEIEASEEMKTTEEIEASEEMKTTEEIEESDEMKTTEVIEESEEMKTTEKIETTIEEMKTTEISMEELEPTEQMKITETTEATTKEMKTEEFFDNSDENAFFPNFQEPPVTEISKLDISTNSGKLPNVRSILETKIPEIPDQKLEDSMEKINYFPIRIIMKAPHLDVYENSIVKHDLLILKTDNPETHDHFDSGVNIEFQKDNFSLSEENADFQKMTDILSIENQQLLNQIPANQEISNKNKQEINQVQFKPGQENQDTRKINKIIFGKDESPGIYDLFARDDSEIFEINNFYIEHLNDDTIYKKDGMAENPENEEKNISENSFRHEKEEEAKMKLIDHYSKLLTWIHYVLN